MGEAWRITELTPAPTGSLDQRIVWKTDEEFHSVEWTRGWGESLRAPHRRGHTVPMLSATTPGPGPGSPPPALSRAPSRQQAASAAPSARPLQGAPPRRGGADRVGKAAAPGGRGRCAARRGGASAWGGTGRGGGKAGWRGGMALPVLSSSGVKFRRVLAHFPQELSLAFAYGSGVFRQEGASAGHGENNMLDFVFAVDDSVTWHMMNLLKNRSHYSFLKIFGPKQISNIQSYGAGIYYNTLVPCNGRMIKYGVISTDTLIDDLLHWKTLYVAGRLQKPVKILTQNENGKLQAALVSNLKSAVTAAFLMLPESFSEEDLYMQIAGLSYSGDFRMIIGEDRSKVQNIVKPNVPYFQKLYSNILQDCPQVVYKHHLGRLEIDKSPEGQFSQLMALPRSLQQKITSLVDPPGKNRDVEEILLQVAHDPDCGLVVHQGISGIVRSSSIVQSAKTILTAGAKKSVTYSMKKLYKMTKGWLKKTS